MLMNLPSMTLGVVLLFGAIDFRMTMWLVALVASLLATFCYMRQHLESKFEKKAKRDAHRIVVECLEGKRMLSRTSGYYPLPFNDNAKSQ